MHPKPIAERSLRAILERIAGHAAAATERGRVASYIPELANADLGAFGIAVVPVGGGPVSAGDADMPFSIQSISKVFTLCLALAKQGDKVWQRVGREPSGNPFNSIVQLEYERGIPRNPFINAGAIVVADILLAGSSVNGTVANILSFVRQVAGDQSIAVDAAVAASESATGHRNRALASFMRAEDNLAHNAEQTLAVYFNQCAIAMSCRQLAKAGCFLASAWDDRDTAREIVTIDRARQINALMMTCGHYDASGEFASEVGIPGKSGVGGGILGVVPGVASIAAWSPGLGPKGNSVLAVQALRELSRETGWSVFGPV